MSTSKQVYDNRYHCSSCGDLLQYIVNREQSGSLGSESLRCESCDKVDNLVLDRGKVFVDVMSDRRRVKGYSKVKHVIKDYQLKTPVSFGVHKWLVYDLGLEKIYFIQGSREYQLSIRDELFNFNSCEELLMYLEPKTLHFENQLTKGSK